MNDPTSGISHHTPLMFMHIPKTGGMSMVASLASIWGSAIADFYVVSDKSPGAAFDSLRNSNNAIYCGHFAFGLHEWLERPSYYISWLREPVARINSLYHYSLAGLESIKLSLNVSKFSDKRLPDRTSSTYYLDFTPWLLEESNPKNFFLSPSPELDNAMVRRFSGFGLDPNPCPDSALDLAKTNIEHYFSVVGLFERYPETLDLVARTFHIPNLNEHHVNKGPSEEAIEPLDENIQKIIREMNRLDIELYEWVSDRFDQQLKNPNSIQVKPGMRTNIEGMPLWRSVGGGVGRKKMIQEVAGISSDGDITNWLFFEKLRSTELHSGMILADVETYSLKANQPPKNEGDTRLIFTTEMAKSLIGALNEGLNQLPVLLHSESNFPPENV